MTENIKGDTKQRKNTKEKRRGKGEEAAAPPTR
jgi:hypothetical protein